ncbi:hypothetical protein OAU90_00450 [Candidatus Pseudothioglobus singularis]|jgi:hypothetical protein|nr:hypothetical protein [Candidatus Pseudothioglobus singularis]|tara:strand:+ start:197 stop:499 length:303 start_codon:yes stop_codon:yes gene_type:complete
MKNKVDITLEEVACIERMTDETRKKYMKMSVEAKKQYSRTQRFIHKNFHQEVRDLEFYMKERRLDFTLEYEEEEFGYSIILVNYDTPVIENFLDIEEVEV